MHSNKLTGNYGQFWTILENFGQFWIILDNFEQNWTILDNLCNKFLAKLISSKASLIC